MNGKHVVYAILLVWDKSIPGYGFFGDHIISIQFMDKLV